MPRGQYTRKPKVADLEAEIIQAEPRRGVVIGETVHQPLAEKTFVEKPLTLQEAMSLAQPLPVHEAEVEQIAALLVPTPVAVPAASFDAWLDEDAAAIPANDRVSQMVQEWATGFIPVDHTVSWLPADDGKALSVLLTTAHGTSELVADAGTWTEADIGMALATMRAELQV